ncbi:MAG: hypothetical protein ACK4P4_02880 [Allorhizobium sp.]
MAQTANYGFQKPGTDNNVDEEFYQLQETLDLLDAILAALQTAVNGKAAVSHTHTISQIVGLAAELAAKMPASQTFKLDDLTDVSGADGAPNGYVLVKSALGWLPSSALAALGTHGHLISEITGLVDALAGKADAAATTSALAGKQDTIPDGGLANAKLANMAQATVKGRASGAGTGGPTDLSASDLFGILGALVPARPQTAAGVGQFLFVDSGSGNGYTLPSGGTWAWQLFSIVVANGTVVVSRSGGGVAAGGTAVLSGIAGETKTGFAWRIA